MFREAADETMGQVVWRFSGSSNSDEDYRAYCESIVRMAAIAASGWRVAILIVEPGNPIPNAGWRKRIAEVSHRVSPQTLFVIVGGALVRGVATAINWIRPPTYVFRAAATMEGAIAIAEEVTDKSQAGFRDLYEQARSMQ